MIKRFVLVGVGAGLVGLAYLGVKAYQRLKEGLEFDVPLDSEGNVDRDKFAEVLLRKFGLSAEVILTTEEETADDEEGDGTEKEEVETGDAPATPAESTSA